MAQKYLEFTVIGKYENSGFSFTPESLPLQMSWSTHPETSPFFQIAMQTIMSGSIGSGVPTNFNFIIRYPNSTTGVLTSVTVGYSHPNDWLPRPYEFKVRIKTSTRDFTNHTWVAPGEVEVFINGALVLSATNQRIEPSAIETVRRVSIGWGTFIDTALGGGDCNFSAFGNGPTYPVLITDPQIILWEDYDAAAKPSNMTVFGQGLTIDSAAAGPNGIQYHAGYFDYITTPAGLYYPSIDELTYFSPGLEIPESSPHGNDACCDSPEPINDGAGPAPGEPGVSDGGAPDLPANQPPWVAACQGGALYLSAADINPSETWT